MISVCRIKGFTRSSFCFSLLWLAVGPQSVCNRCVIKVFGGVLSCLLVVEFSVGIWVFVIGLSQISFFFSFYSYFSLIGTGTPYGSQTLVVAASHTFLSSHCRQHV